MDEKILNELLELLSQAIYARRQGKAIPPQEERIYEWMQKNAPQYLKS
jgi:hypothetical protein